MTDQLIYSRNMHIEYAINVIRKQLALRLDTLTS